eukprot:m.69383 g.69383  ORF g.69383 m.69383 type:complete len:60 (-) comp9965_c0_seq2:6-185(-)
MGGVQSNCRRVLRFRDQRSVASATVAKEAFNGRLVLNVTPLSESSIWGSRFGITKLTAI